MPPAALPSFEPEPGTFWSLLGDADRRVLAEADGRLYHHPEGTVVLREHSTPGAVLVVVAGRVKVQAAGREGHLGFLAIRIPGDILGELAVIDSAPRSATVTAIEPISVWRIPAREFDRILGEHAKITHAVLKVTIRRLREANRHRIRYTDSTAAHRVVLILADLMVHYGRRQGAVVAIDLPLGQEEIAGLIAASRQTVVRGLRELRDAGIIDTGRQRIRVLDPDALARRAAAHHP